MPIDTKPTLRRARQALHEPTRPALKTLRTARRVHVDLQSGTSGAALTPGLRQRVPASNQEVECLHCARKFDGRPHGDGYVIAWTVLNVLVFALPNRLRQVERPRQHVGRSGTVIIVGEIKSHARRP